MELVLRISGELSATYITGERLLSRMDSEMLLEVPFLVESFRTLRALVLLDPLMPPIVGYQTRTMREDLVADFTDIWLGSRMFH